MSGAPKKPHEEGGHSSSVKYPLEDTGVYPKLTSSVLSNECHQAPYEMGQDARVKITQSESRDSDRRLPLHSMHQMPSSSLFRDSYVESHPPTSESRLKLRDSKENPRMDSREFYGEAKRDTQSVKGEKDARFDSIGDDNKEVKYDRENYGELKGDVKAEKDVHGVLGGQLNWKEPKELLRGKRYSESPSNPVDSWPISRGNSQGPVEVGKDRSVVEERDYVESYEATGEYRVDSKGDDRFKDKDRKRKDSKHWDWVDRDKERSDRRSSMQVGNSSSEYKEFAREEKEAEKWERDRKDLSKEKERPKEREKDHIKRESWNGVGKEGLQNEIEMRDSSIRVPQPEQENLALEQKKQKEFGSRKNGDQEARDRRREREADIEGDRPEKRSRCYDKESDDGCTDGEGATERERENFNYGVQQHKRILRPRGSPQVGIVNLG